MYPPRVGSPHGAKPQVDGVRQRVPAVGGKSRGTRRKTAGTPWQDPCGSLHRGAGRASGVAGGPATRHFLPGALASPESEESAAMKASCGTSTRPTIFIRFLPSFCFSSSLRFRLMSPP